MLCYFPSYVLMDKIMARWKTTLMHDRINDIKHIVVEPRGTSLSPSVYFSEIYYLYSTCTICQVVRTRVLSLVVVSTNLHFLGNLSQALGTPSIIRWWSTPRHCTKAPRTVQSSSPCAAGR